MTETDKAPSAFRPARDGFRWDDVALMPYKDAGDAPFKAISRQTLFGTAELGCELRYFEIDAGGYSTLERHQHMHGVMILRGSGQCLVGAQVRAVGPHDLVTIPAWTWHQFRATDGGPLGFLCMVNAERDRPRLPDAGDLAALRTEAAVAAFLDGAAVRSD